MSRARGLDRGEAAALLICSVFAAAAVFLLVTGDPGARRIAFGTLAFFGGGALIYVAVWLRRRAEARNLGAHGVSIVGGVPLRVRTGRMALVGLALIAVGAAYGWGFGERGGRIAWVLGGIQIASGALVLALAAWRNNSRGLRFEPEGIHLVDGGVTFSLPWEEIADVVQLEFHSNAFVALRVHDVARAVSRAGARRRNGADAAETLRKMFERNRHWVGNDVWIHPSLYGLDAVLLTAALRRYVAEPAARTELATRSLPAAA